MGSLSTPTASHGLVFPRACVEGHEQIALSDGWQAAACAPDSHTESSAREHLDWIPARVPGTAALALAGAGLWHPGDRRDLETQDWWFRTGFQAQPLDDRERVVLLADGIATVYEVYLNGRLILEDDSMFAGHTLDVGLHLRASNELMIRCRALTPLLGRRRGPRARWRTRLVFDGRVRSFRTSLLGRSPGFSDGPVAVGPWRALTLERRRDLLVEGLHLRARLRGQTGELTARVRLSTLDGQTIRGVQLELEGPTGTHRAPLELSAERATVGASATAAPAAKDGWMTAHGTLPVTSVKRWWPHTHGEPVLYKARLLVQSSRQIVVDAGHVGFRELRFAAGLRAELERDGLDLHVNGVRVFVRGAVWTPVDPIGLAPSDGELREALERLRDAGMNMVRLPGTGTYETGAFHDLCDRLGILVWQDLMYANLDYPLAAEDFAMTAEQEAVALLQALGARPSLAVLCGNSEIEQQVSMLGLDPALGRAELFARVLPRLIAEHDLDAAYLPSTPCGGELPFRPERGIANYYGVGAYRRPLSDARLSGVRFAAECLAFSNVPCRETVERMLAEAPDGLVVHHPAWKAGVPRDTGAGWDFEDVRDHYLELLFGVSSRELRSQDHDRYLELSRAVSGEVMAEVFGEWRRRDSSCNGALVLWMRDLSAGAGWGLIDHRGVPKPAYHDLRRALAPIAVWSTDEGLGGIRVHVANDRGTPLACRLRVALYRDLEHQLAVASEHLLLGPHEGCERDLEGMLGRFVDAGYSYRFGAPGHDLILLSLEREDDGAVELLAQSVRFPLGRPSGVESARRLELRAEAQQLEDGSVELSICSRRLAYRVSPRVHGFRAEEDHFCVEPGTCRKLRLLSDGPSRGFQPGVLTALNLDGQVPITAPGLVSA